METAEMDVLTDVLQTVRVSSVCYGRVELGAPWGIQVSASESAGRVARRRPREPGSNPAARGGVQFLSWPLPVHFRGWPTSASVGGAGQ